MAEAKAKDTKEPQVADLPNDKKEEGNNKTDDVFGYMCDIDDFLELSEEARGEFLKKWCNKQTPNVKNIITALKNAELDRIELEVQYEKELSALEAKLQTELNEINKQRADIIRGIVEPKLDEAPWMEDEREMMEEALAELESTSDSLLEEVLAEVKPIPKNAKGIPRFWLHLLKNIDITEDLIEEADEPLLEKLYDIKVVQDNIEGFALEFYFEENKYFTNDKLYKTYKYEFNYDKKEPFEYDGPYIKSCTGCVINWLEGKNLTVEISTRQLQKKNGSIVTLTSTIPKRSFFNYFRTPKVNVIHDISDEFEFSELRNDFDLAHELKSEIIPKAVLYYCGDTCYECDIYDSDSECSGCSNCMENSEEQSSSVDDNSADIGRYD